MSKQLLNNAQAAELSGDLEEASRLYQQYYLERPFRTQYFPLTAATFVQPKKHPLLSIIVPCYNSGKYIEHCLDSILDQEFHDFELIVVDDGSSDDSLNLILRKALSDSRIVVLKNSVPSGSAGLPRNQALDIAKGKLIGFVDSDDWIGPSYFQILVETLEKNNADVVVSTGFVNHQRNDSNKRIYPKKWRIKSSDPHLSCTHMSSMIWDKVYRRDFLQDNDIRLGSYPAAVDVPFILKVYYHCKTPVIANTDAYHYRRETENSVTVRFRKNTSCDFELKAYQEIFCWSDKNNVPEAYKAYMQLKRLSSFVYTCKLVSISFFSSYFNKCRKILIDSDTESFRNILSVSGNKELVKLYEFFMNDDKYEFVESQRPSDTSYFIKNAVTQNPHIVKTVLPSAESFRAGTRNLVFFPDWSLNNPYQHLFYKNMQNNALYTDINVLGLGIDDINLSNLLKLVGHGDIVHIHWVHPFIATEQDAKSFCQLLKLLKSERNALIVWTIHNTVSHECKDRDAELCYRKDVAICCDRFIVHTNYAAAEVQDLYNVPRGQIYVVPHGKYDVNPKKISGLIKMRTSTKRNLRLTMLGDLRSYKNTEWSVEFLRNLNKQLEPEDFIELRIAGKSTSISQFDYLTDAAGSEDFLSLNLKRLSDDELLHEFSQSDFIFAPYTKLLTSGICINAISHGIPFIAPAFPSLLELHREGRSFLYKDQDDLVNMLLKYNSYFHRGILDLLFDSKRIMSESSELDWRNIFANIKSERNPFETLE